MRYLYKEPEKIPTSCQSCNGNDNSCSACWGSGLPLFGTPTVSKITTAEGVVFWAISAGYGSEIPQRKAFYHPPLDRWLPQSYNWHKDEESRRLGKRQAEDILYRLKRGEKIPKALLYNQFFSPKVANQEELLYNQFFSPSERMQQAVAR